MIGPSPQLAHIGNIPVEEWVPFVVPIVALFLYGRRRERRRRSEIGQIPTSSEQLDAAVVERITAEWRKRDYEDITTEHLGLLYPPGPDGRTVKELAGTTHADPAHVLDLLEQLEVGDYLLLEGEPEDPQTSLTVKGYGLVDATEDSLLTALRAVRSPGATRSH
jgi:hypothetical protein